MAEPTNEKRMTRRDFLLRGGFVLGALFGLDKLGSVVIDEALKSTTGDMKTLVPQEFLYTELPTKNEYYRPPEEILRDAFYQYSVRRGQDHALPPLFFQKGENYLDLVSLGEKLPRALVTDPNNPKANTITGRLYKVLYGIDKESDIADQVNGDNYAFSSFSIDGVQQLLVYDPGSGIVSPIVERLCRKFRYTREEFYTNLSAGIIPQSDMQEATDTISRALLDATVYFGSCREKLSSPLSISSAIEYFLEKNKGDIYASLWDTTLYFKLFVRNDMTSLRTKVTFDQAKELAFLFRDEFSPALSLNWLMEAFEKKRIPISSELMGSGAYDSVFYKDFMPINRDGGYYHALNIMTWAAVCMDPALVKDTVLAYYNQENLGAADYKPEHGPEKVNADILVAIHAQAIHDQVTLYTK